MPNRRLVNLPSASTPLTGNELYYAVSSANVDVKVLGSLLGGGGGTPGGVSPQIQYNNAGAFGGLTDGQVTSRIQSFSSALSGATPASPGGTGTFLRADGTWASPPVSSAATPPAGSSGQVQINAGGGSFGAVTNTQLTALINSFTSALAGDVPASGGGSANFLRADGSWSVPASTGGASPGGSSGNVQINNGGGSFAGITNTTLTSLINVFSITSSSLSGATPGSTGGATNFLRADGTWAVPASTGAGSPGGSSGQVQINNGGGSFAGITNTTLTADINLFSSIASGAVTASSSFGALAFLRADNTFSTTLGSTGSPAPAGTGSLTLVGASSGSATITPQSAGSVYNFNLPTTAGTSNQLFVSGGGGSNPTTWTFTPTLGSTTTSVTGTVTLVGQSSGSVTITPSSAGSVYNLQLPTAAGSSGQLLQSSTAATTPMNWTYTPTLGSTGASGATGALTLVGVSSGSATIQASSMGAIYNFNLPVSAGVPGQLLQSQSGGSLPMQWTATPVLGSAGVATGTLAFKGVTSGTVTVQPQAASGIYNFNLPITAGSSYQVLTSMAGSAAMIWTSMPYISADVFGFLPSASGTTNWNAMISALSFVSGLGGGTIFIPRGTYTITPVALPAIAITANNTRLLGAGMAETIITAGTLGQDLINVNALRVSIESLQLTSSSAMSAGTAAIRVKGDKITVRDVFISGGTGGGNGGLIYDGIVLAGSANNYWQLFDNCAVNLCTHAAIYVTGSGGTLDASFRDINIGCFWGTSGNPTSSNATQYGFRCDYTGAGGGLLDNVQILQSYDFGVSVTGAAVGSGWTFVKTAADTCGTDDYNFLNAYNIWINNCWAGATLGSAASNQGNGFTFNGCYGVTVNNCTGADIATMFVWLQNSNDITCIGNRCSWGNQNNSGAGSGVYVLGCNNFVVSGNVINNSSREFGTAGLFRYGCQIDATSSNQSTFGRVDGNVFHPMQTGTVLANSSLASISIGTNLGP
jgi:hypothetical protein